MFLSQAMVIAGEAFGMSQKALVRVGYDKTTARMIKKLAGIYYGRTNNPRRQERARSTARETGCSFASLQAIERFVAKLPKKHAWKIREALVPLAVSYTHLTLPTILLV